MAAPSEEKQEDNNEIRVVITGANRGLGLEFVKQLLQRKNYVIVACCRKPDTADDLKKLQNENKNRLSIEKLESTSESDIENVKKSLENKPIDILLLNAGIISRFDEGVGNIEKQRFENMINVNVIGPCLLGQALYDNVKKSTRKQIIGMSSGLGSIGDATSNSYLPYRCSKAGVNMMMKCFGNDA